MATSTISIAHSENFRAYPTVVRRTGPSGPFAHFISIHMTFPVFGFPIKNHQTEKTIRRSKDNTMISMNIVYSV